MALGYNISTMALPAGASVLDMGPGWGNTTIALARMGYKVTAIDIDPTFVDLIRARANKLSLDVDVRCGGFLDIDQLEQHFDAVLFFESFHHCSDHRKILQRLARIIEPEGRLFFAAEPIDDSFAMPWGIRLDGESLWAIRRNGWLELGFQESYFVRMLHHLGWLCTKHVNVATHLGVIFEARRANGRYEMSTFRLPPDEDATWARPETDERLKHRYSAGHSVLSLQKGLNSDLVKLEAVNPSPQPIPFRAQHGRHTVRGLATPLSDLTIQLPYDPRAEGLIIEATTWRPCDLGESLDDREIGLAVRTVELTDRGGRKSPRSASPCDTTSDPGWHSTRRRPSK
jgi:2-polyprenyl-3-methyl-5-hydroxy-6-metoxy-1,4-benzoquinol methylase